MTKKEMIKILKGVYDNSTPGDLVTVIKGLEKPTKIKAVMTEYINDNNEWEWTEIATNTTPREAIKRYLIDNELITNDKSIKFTIDSRYTYTEGHDVRAFYITI